MKIDYSINPISKYFLLADVPFRQGINHIGLVIGGNSNRLLLAERVQHLALGILKLVPILGHIIALIDTLAQRKAITHIKLASPAPLEKAPFVDKNEDVISDEENTTSLTKNNEFDKFKKTLKELNTNEKSIHELGIELSNIVPKAVNLEDVVDCVFKHYYKWRIIPLLDAILDAYPSFTLSPYNQIRRAIVEDENHLITNQKLLSMLKKHHLDSDVEKMAACDQLAYRMDNPYIYQPAQITVKPTDYTINFLWINLNPQNRNQDKAKNIFGDGLNLLENAECLKDPQTLVALEKESSEESTKIKKTFTYRLLKWAEVHPNTEVNLWYDSALVTQQAQQKTFEMLLSVSKSAGVSLKMRDIRRLSNLKKAHPIIKNSLNPLTPLFYRVDLLKVLIADHMIRSPDEAAKYFVFSDIDVDPMTTQQMFDKRTIDYLSSSGYVFNRVGSGEFENSFFIFNREKEDLKKIHRREMIKGVEHLIYMRSLGSEAIYGLYDRFRNRLEPQGAWDDDRLLAPRKVVKCPPSQFNPGQKKAPHTLEKFCFHDYMPYPICDGRYSSSKSEIETLMSSFSA